jgi:putative hemin transport protein
MTTTLETLAPAAAPLPTTDLRAGYTAARAAGATRHRDIAAQLGVSEAELLAAHIGEYAPGASVKGLQVQRLRGPWPTLLGALEAAGPLMALTRNASCVHEKTGVYSGASANGPAGREMGLVLGPDIDLRVFYSRWAHGFAVAEDNGRGLQQSLQFFDAQGQAVHKVFVRPGTQWDVWAALVITHRCELQQPGLQVLPAAAPAAETPDALIDTSAFREGWAGLRDTHDFFSLLRRHGVSRTQALRLADPAYAQRVEASAARDVLQTAAREALPIMVFVGNPGVIQIHTGPVKRVEVMGPWLNVLDPGFNLHLREDHIVQAWAVRKPTADGLVSALELFDAQGETIAMFFGERKPGRPELRAWRALVDSLVDPRAVQAQAWQPQAGECAAC